MKLQTAFDAYSNSTDKVSTITRQLSLSGIAIIWLFCQAKDGVVTVPEGLTDSVLLIVLSLIFDLFQYAYKSIIWGIFKTLKYHNDSELEDEVIEPWWFNYPTLLFFWGKVVLMLLAYYYLIIYLVDNSLII